VLAGRTLPKAQAFAVELNSRYPGERVSSVQVDAADPASLRTAFQDADMVVVASSTAAYARQVASVALEANIDYLDVQYSTEKIAVLKSMAAEIKAADRCFITDGGFHPGLPAAMVRFAAARFDQLRSAVVGSVIKVDWRALDLSVSTMEEFVGEFVGFTARVYKDRRWQVLGLMSMMKPIYMDFGPPYGRQYGVPMYMEELGPLPDLIPELEETAFYVGGLNWFVDFFLSPVIMAGVKLFPNAGRRPMGRLMYWGLANFSSPPYGTLLQMEAAGTINGTEKKLVLRVSHPDGYALTAIPVAACLLQVLDGTIQATGLCFESLVVEPNRFITDIERLGAQVDCEMIP
jgi:saccharopine dehydrogenase (NAD+, L-lysine-forming)